jgi:lipopolysaccharide transport system ATP-binding protein
MSLRLRSLDAELPPGAVIGIIGEENSGQETLIREAGGVHVRDKAGLRFDAPVIVLDHALDRCDPLARARAAHQMARARNAGAVILLLTYDERLLLEWCDELWWLEEGKLAGRGDPREIWTAYQRHVAARVRAWGESLGVEIAPRMRRGDGRATVEAIELLGENGRPTAVWRSGELAVVRVSLRFDGEVANPVAGVLIRTRIGLDVYGTNTELEGLRFGPRRAGERVRLTFSFRCELCPGEYTLTVASHDPDGVWHDWLEDAVAFTVTDGRYTAGVANLRARAELA